MDFVKKNLGLLVYALVCLVAAAVIIVGIQRTAKTVAKAHEDVQRQREFFTKMKDNEFTLNNSNLSVAQENITLVEKKFLELRTWLAQTYAVTVDSPPTSVECVTVLEQEVRKLNAELEKKKIVVNDRTRLFSFDSLATSAGILPPAAEVPAIMRDLKIIKEVVRIVSLSEVRELTSIERIMPQSSINEDLHSRTPLRIAVLGTLPQIQRLINMLNTQSMYLFDVRNVRIVGDDPAPNGSIAGFTDLSRREEGGATPGGVGAPGMPPGAEMGKGMPPGEAAMGMPGMPGMPGAMGGGRAAARPAAATRGAERAQTPAVDLALRAKSLRKSDLIVFPSSLLAADIRFNLIEFREPKQEN